MAIANALQLEAARRRASCSGLFKPYLYGTCAQTAIFQLPIKILNLTIDILTTFIALADGTPPPPEPAWELTALPQTS